MAANRGRGIVSRAASYAVNNPLVLRIRKLLNCSCINGKTVTKVKRHMRSHWKQWFAVIVTLVVAYFAYKFSKELTAQVKQISNTIAEYAEEKRKIFG
jgi:hypothetical protein